MILGKKEKQLIEKWYHIDLNILRLKKYDPDIDLEFIINQIKGRKKAKTKCPTWFSSEDIIYPPYLSMEQSSSERTAKRKASFFKNGNVLDMTGGMGIDACFISRHVQQYTLCEQQEKLVQINIQNFNILKRNNIYVHHGNSIEYLKNSNELYSTIYLDPARRNQSKNTKSNKVFFLEDCEPNVIQLWDLLKSKSNQIIIKLSPMLDISHALKQLDDISRIVVIAVKNEVKELILIYNKGEKERKFEAINLLTDGQESYFTTRSSDLKKNIEFSEVKQFIYEPNKAILKANLQDQYHSQLGLQKLHPNTHFYTSEFQNFDYQGKTFEVVHTLPSSPKAVKKLIPSQNINVISRNHPLKAPDIEKKYELKSGEDGYVIAFTDIKGRKLVFAKLRE